jgi:hypothetical protein
MMNHARIHKQQHFVKWKAIIRLINLILQVYNKSIKNMGLLF